jgi:hypothetical protein
MHLLLSFGLVLAGFILGTFLFSRGGHWLLGIFAVIKSRRASGAPPLAARLAAATLLASGPWLFIAVGAFAFYVRGQSWAIWLFGGVCVALIYFSGLSVHLARKAAASSAKKHAA